MGKRTSFSKAAARLSISRRDWDSPSASFDPGLHSVLSQHARMLLEKLPRSGESVVDDGGRTVGGVLHLDPIAGRLDDSQFNGRIVPSARLIRAQIDRIDANRYLPPGQVRAKEKKATLEALIEQLGELDIDAEIRIGEARVGGAKLRDSVIRVERNPAPAQ